MAGRRRTTPAIKAATKIVEAYAIAKREAENAETDADLARWQILCEILNDAGERALALHSHSV